MSRPSWSACWAMRSRSGMSSMPECAPKPKTTSCADNVLPFCADGNVHRAAGRYALVKGDRRWHTFSYASSGVWSMSGGAELLGEAAGEQVGPLVRRDGLSRDDGRAVRSGQLTDTPTRAEGQQDHGV